MRRREFIKMGVGTFAGISMGRSLLGAGLPGARTSKKMPNVLFMIADDLNDSIAGMGGHPDAKTPNINRLMQRGVRFTNAHCNAPLCSPSRASFMTGLYPATSGLYGYDQQSNPWRENPVLKNAITMPEHFMHNGYNAYRTGKIFHNYHRDPSAWQKKGFDGNGIPPSFGPFPWDGVSKFSSGEYAGMGHSSLPYPYNFNYWDGFGSLADIPTTPPIPEYDIPGYTGWVDDFRVFKYVDENNRDLMPDELSVEWVSERLSETHDDPFFMALGFNRPHTPMYAPQKYFDMFALDEISYPPFLEHDLEDCAEILWKDPISGRKIPLAQALDELRAAGPNMWRKWLQAYLACTAFVDDLVGKTLDALERSPYADNTIIIFTGDHGYHMGEKNHLFKMTMWEETTRVPLVIYAPGISKAGEECTLPVSLIDLYPTLIDLCELPGAPNKSGNRLPLDGHSLRPLIENPKGSWDGPPVALSCLHGDKQLAPNEPGKPEDQHFTVRSERWRYTLCNNGEEELYDHKTDPHEWKNLARDPKQGAIKARLRKELLKLSGRPS